MHNLFLHIQEIWPQLIHHTTYRVSKIRGKNEYMPELVAIANDWLELYKHESEIKLRAQSACHHEMITKPGSAAVALQHSLAIQYPF
jgi:hypothetical protein